jgi:putative nucleotidyltransferase-like protein
MPDASLDWKRFLRLARFHRVQGLVWKSLASLAASVPEQIGEALSNDAAKIVASNLVAAAQCAGLLPRFTASGVPVLFLKGLTLGALAYGTSTVKAAADIDLLIPPAMLDESIRLLQSLGCRAVEPRNADAQRLRRWHRLRKESLWAKQGAIGIDLHTRVSDTARLIACIDNQSPQQLVDIGNGIALPTLADDELFAYLAVHGSWSMWFRLKWIADFAALVGPLAPAEIDRRYRRSLELGAGRCGAVALLLADALFDSLSGNDALRDELRHDRAVRWLCRSALKQVAGRQEPVEPTAVRLGTARIHWSELFLVPGLSFKLSELARQGFVAAANLA